ncbi:MAG: DUF262 domain-containing protein [Rhodothermaceae bacterium]|nr:DUF262 domain-containing protein [Rhodothermaceae bacterium]MYC03819.1 DUF262 domain-containing protein [Rhodothermaceae bacterium]MYI17527.1 DUF262 domain-containing protein [Rhodothermaceae bacterium]
MSIRNQIRAEVVPEVIFLGKLMERIVSGKIRVPKFQRPFIWRQNDIFALLESVYMGFPIGSILVWETEQENIESTSFVGPIEVGHDLNGKVGYLLDGQQRVSTLVGTLRLPNEYQSVSNGIDWRVYFDLEKREFTRAPKGVIDGRYFPMASLLDTSGFLAAARKIETFPDELQRRNWLNAADRIANAFRDYQLPIIRIQEADLDSAVTVFARLNRTGRKISADQMVSALTYREGEFHLSGELDGYINELTRKGFGNLNRVFLLRSVLAALSLDIYAKDWAGLVVKADIRPKLPDAFEDAAGGINGALEFLKNLGITSDRLLPYGLQLVLLGEFYRLCPIPTPEQDKLLRRWFWVTSFTGWFGSVNSSRATHALREIRELAKGERSELSVVSLDEKALPFPIRFNPMSARARAFLLYLVSLQPLSLKNPVKLEPGKLLSELGSSAIGYVWYNPGEAEEFSSISANRMFLDRDLVDNAFDHLTELDDSMLKKLLPSHGFPAGSIQMLRDGDRNKFILQRQEYLIQGERRFMGDRGVNLPESGIAETVTDSDTSDTDD